MCKRETLTRRQRQLLELIDRRSRYGVPAVQRDLAEELGIRRDSLNKLLARTRRTLGDAAVAALRMPARSRPRAESVCSLSALTNH